MHASLSDYVNDTFVAQQMSAVTECRLRPIAHELPGSAAWITTFMSKTVLVSTVPPELRALCFAVLRRAEAAVEDFDAAASELAAFVGSRKQSSYFRVLRKLEGAIGSVWQAVTFLREAEGSKIKIFEANDGSVPQRLNAIYNISRHGAPMTLPPGHIQLVWLTNEGLHATQNGIQLTLTFEELRGDVAELGDVADKFSGYKATSGPPA